MRVTVECVPDAQNEIVLRCRELDAEMLSVLGMLHAMNARLPGRDGEGQVQMVSADTVLYADTVDGKTFLLTEKMTLQVDMSLLEVEAAWGEMGIVRISKGQLVNLYHVHRLRSIMAARVEVTMNNGEKLIVSRHYVQRLKEKLGIKRSVES